MSIRGKSRLHSDLDCDGSADIYAYNFDPANNDKNGMYI
jgi:hypothetical protein